VNGKGREKERKSKQTSPVEMYSHRVDRIVVAGESASDDSSIWFPVSDGVDIRQLRTRLI
jgi:hypothetical protein